MDAPEYYSDLNVRLGKGSYGTVYKGYMKENKQSEIAVKRIVKDPGDISNLENDKKEIQIMKRLSDHTNVVKILDVYECPNFMYIIMEFCDLKDLTQYLKERKPNMHSKVSIMYQCANAIEYIHNLKPCLVHRDIKPANILMKSMGQHDIVKLADFGMAKIFDPAQNASLTKIGVGTIAYNAPELFDTGMQYSSAVDVFSLGMVFLVLLNYGYTTESLEPQPECLIDQNYIHFGLYLLTQYGKKSALPVTPPAVFSFSANEKWPLLELKSLISNMLSFDSSDRRNMCQVKSELTFYLDQLNSEKDCPNSGKTLCYRTLQHDVTRPEKEYTQDNEEYKYKRREQYENLLQTLHLDKNNKITLDKLLVIDEEAISERVPVKVSDLPRHIFHKIMMLNYKARCVTIESVMDSEGDKKESEDILEFLKEDTDGDINIDTIDKPHPSDVLLAMIYCSDMFVQQYFVTKLSQCQVALPLLIHNPSNFKPVFPLWMLRSIHKRWCTKTESGSKIYKEQQMISAKSVIFSFLRFGEVSLSKSELMNSILNRNHEIFIHRNSKGSKKDRVLFDGVAELTWYLPNGKKDVFPDLTTFVNFRGNAKLFRKEVDFICNISKALIIFISQNSFREKSIQEKVVDLEKRKIHVLYVIVDTTTPLKQSENTWKYGVSQVNKADMTEQIQKCLQSIFCDVQKSSYLSLEECMQKGKELEITCDGDNPQCESAKRSSLNIINIFNNQKEFSSVKETFLPLQGKEWREYSLTEKKLHRLNIPSLKENDSIQEYEDKQRQEQKILRQAQKKRGFPVNDVMKLFIDNLSSNHSFTEANFFMKWMKFELDSLSMKHLTDLNNEYDILWSEVNDIRRKLAHDAKNHKVEHNEKLEEGNLLKEKQTMVEAINVNIFESSIGIEHFLREFSQLYDCSKAEKCFTQITKYLPEIASNLLLHGHSIELMDGDAGNVPREWISSVFKELASSTMPKEARVFVLTILGIQSTGKSTLLNAMFGLEFSVSAGRCTRGAYMQMLKVSENVAKKLNYDYVLIIDTEGLRAPELSSEHTLTRDNELATFIIGIGDMTVINIFGENTSNINDVLEIVVQAFLRMKQVKIKPRCYFVHQNVGAVDAEKKHLVGKRQMMEKLNLMTSLAAEDVGSHEKSFNEVINFDEDKNICYLSSLWQGDPPMAPPNPGYSENVQTLKCSLLNTVHEQNIPCLTITQLSDRLQDLWQSLLSENFVFSFKNTLEIAAYKSIEEMYIKWKWQLLQYIEEEQAKGLNKIRNAGKSTDIVSKIEAEIRQAAERKHEEISVTAAECIEEDRQKHILIQWKGKVLNNLASAKEDLVVKALNRLCEYVNAQKVYSQIDEEIKNCQNIFLSKAQELAKEMTADTTPSQQKSVFDEAWTKWQDDAKFKCAPIHPIDFWQRAETFLYQHYPTKTKHISKTLKQYKLADIKEFTLDDEKHIDLELMAKAKDFFWYGNKLASAIGKEVMNLTAAVLENANRDLTTITEDGIDNYTANTDSYFLRQTMNINHTVRQWPLHGASLKDTFMVDLTIVILNKTVQVLENLHLKYMRKHDQKLILEARKKEIYEIFLKYIEGANEGVVKAHILKGNISNAIWTSFKEKAVQKITSEVRQGLPAINGNRYNLELHIKTHLVEKECFTDYMKYINRPKDFANIFIFRYINSEVQHGKDIFRCIENVLKTTLLDLYGKCKNAQSYASQNSMSLSDWEENFVENVKEHVYLDCTTTDSAEKMLVGQEFEFFSENIKDQMIDVEGWCIQKLKDLLEDKVEMLDLLRRSSETICKFYINDCCWEYCPFCHEVCVNTMQDHDGDHIAMFHRPQGLGGWYRKKTGMLVIEQCTSLLKGEIKFKVRSGQYVPFKTYKDAGPPYSKWNITPDESLQKHWQWFCEQFRTDIETYHDKKFPCIPKGWKSVTKEDVLMELQK